MTDRFRLEPGAHGAAIAGRLDAWDAEGFARRLWAGDHTLWRPDPDEIADRLGWLTLPATMRPDIAAIERIAAEIAAAGIRDAVVLGMGGSSLAPEVYQAVFGNRPGFPNLTVLDSTHPDEVARVDTAIDPDASVFVVASKSGTTVESLSFFRYFWKMSGGTGDRFIAITDPGTPLADLAGERRFRATFLATADVGGRYSALTAFGLVPAALIGVAPATLLDAAAKAATDIDPGRPASLSATMRLGAALGELAAAGRDKVTLSTTASLEGFPAWLEQLIAESTGKDGTGILPVAGEVALDPAQYGDDRFFVHYALDGDHDEAAWNTHLDALVAAGHPVARLRLEDRSDLAAEMFRAEVAVAAAGAVLGIQPFDQPDVELAKRLAREAMAGSAGDGTEPAGITIGDGPALRDALGGWLAAAAPGGYVALQAYLAPLPHIAVAIDEIRHRLGDLTGLATTFGWGPRFLHSTGQYHKGGPDGGLFLQLVDQARQDVAVPETDFTFGELIAAQALGDLGALHRRGRTILRVDLGADAPGGLARLLEMLGE